jgi:hypothetical protein
MDVPVLMHFSYMLLNTMLISTCNSSYTLIYDIECITYFALAYDVSDRYCNSNNSIGNSSAWSQ